MKKFVKNLLAGFIVLPCSLLLNACDNNTAVTNPEYELTVQSIYELVQAKGYEGSFDEFLLAIKGADGQDGEDGRSIVSVQKILSNGNVDTYQIKYSDNTSTTYTITNGIDGADGKNGSDGSDGQDGNGIVSISKLPGNNKEYKWRILRFICI